MSPLAGLAWLLVFQSLGEGISRLLHVPLPAPVIGMLLLLPALGWEPVRTPVSAAAELLLAHFSLLFVPVGLGVITHLELVRQFGWQILVVLVASSWISLAVTALVLRSLLRRSTPAGEV